MRNRVLFWFDCLAMRWIHRRYPDLDRAMEWYVDQIGREVRELLQRAREGR